MNTDSKDTELANLKAAFISEFGEEKKAKEFVEQLKSSKKLHDAYAKTFRDRYQISGKLLSQWREHFRIQMPDDLNPRLCLEVGQKLMALHQEATNLKSDAEARLAAKKTVYQKQFRDAFYDLVEEYKSQYKKLPAKDTLTALAEKQVAELYDAMSHTEIEIGFFKEILADLANSRKLIENATINLSIEAKALQNDRYMDALNRHHNHDNNSNNGGKYYE